MQIISKKKQPVSDALLYINSEITRKQYHRRLELFFDYIGLEGEDLDAQGQAFLEQARTRVKNCHYFVESDSFLSS